MKRILSPLSCWKNGQVQEFERDQIVMAKQQGQRISEIAAQLGFLACLELNAVCFFFFFLLPNFHFRMERGSCQRKVHRNTKQPYLTSTLWDLLYVAGARDKP